MKKFGLIGHPIDKSMSPALFRAGYSGKYAYDLIEGADFTASYDIFLKDYDGINVTAPFKEKACAEADILSPEVARTGAANLLVKTPEGVRAYNTDYYGVILSVADGAVVTSGGYQRNFTLDGKTYHHILDRATLAPAESGLKSVTIVAESGTRADALSTALFVMGEEKAEAFHREHGGFEYILITDENQVVVSTGLQASFTLENSQYDYK